MSGGVKLKLENRLKVVMAEKDMRVIDLANKTKLNANYLTDVRNGRVEPGIYNALVIARALNVNVEDIWYIKK